jgi:hypothetical protein
MKFTAVLIFNLITRFFVAYILQYLAGVQGWTTGLVYGLNIAYVSVGLDSFQRESEQGRAFPLSSTQIGLFGKPTFSPVIYLR